MTSTNMWVIACKDPSTCDGVRHGFEFQVFDPGLSPTECQTGTCKSSPTAIPALYVCQP